MVERRARPPGEKRRSQRVVVSDPRVIKCKRHERGAMSIRWTPGGSKLNLLVELLGVERGRYRL